MNTTLKGKVSEVFTKYNFSVEDAQFLTDVLQEIDDRQRSEFDAKLGQLLNQKDKTDLTLLMQQNKTELIGLMQQDKTELIGLMQKDKTELIDRVQRVETSLTRQVYIVGLIQFLAIVGALIGIINFALK
jgi:hypothetical protein